MVKKSEKKEITDLNSDTPPPEGFKDFAEEKIIYGKLNKSIIEKALTACNGNIGLSARTLNVCYSTVNNYLKKHPELRKIREKCLLSRLDLAQDKLEENVVKGQQAAIEYTLDNLGKLVGFQNEVSLKVITEQLEPVVRQMVSIINNTVKDAKTKESILRQFRELIRGNDSGGNNTTAIENDI